MIWFVTSPPSPDLSPVKQHTVVLMSVLAGCALEEGDVDPPVTQVESALIGKCPEPEDCTVSNNGGVYTAELGYAGFGPTTGDFMIKHFINFRGSVTFEGRFQDGSDGLWKTGTGRVVGAWYTRVNQPRRYYAVEEIRESFTTPTFQLRYGNDPAFDVTGPAMVDFPNGDKGNLVLELFIGPLELAYQPPPQIQIKWLTYTETQGFNSFIRSAKMNWRFINPSVGPWTHYCIDDLDQWDGMVLQQDIGINAVSGDVEQHDGYVTMSCTNGGISRAREWGFSYRTTQQELDTYTAAIHMKRASYCGDRAYYTVGGTEIKIWDTLSGGYPDVTSIPDVTKIEALWDKYRAICVNPMYERHDDVTYPPAAEDPNGSYFVGDCIYAQPQFSIPACNTSHLSQALLASKKVITP
jgi:hypothetical protein